jgi:ornithine cyclodeaminase/alanine dehydrogenase-like protein (mu-crystallin family)
MTGGAAELAVRATQHLTIQNCMQHFTEEEVRALLPMRACIDQMRRAFEELCAGRAVNQARRRLILKTGSVLHQMAGSFRNYFATKIYSSNLKHGGLHQMFVLLYDAETGKPLAFMEANHLSLIRTGAATGYAAEILSDPKADVLAVIGSGYQARTQVEAVRTVRPIREVRVWSRTPENARKFAAGIGGRAMESAEAAVRGAPIVVTITSSKDPVLESGWIRPGAFIAAAGSNAATRRELPADLLGRAGLVCVDNLEQARIEAGDFLIPNHWDGVIELKDVTPGYDPGRVAVFKSLGIAVEDAAAAAYVYEQRNPAARS